MHKCSKCGTANPETPGICEKCGAMAASAEAADAESPDVFSSPQDPGEPDGVPRSVQRLAARADDAEWGNTRWASSWGRKGLRLGFMVGMVLGLVGAVGTLLDESGSARFEDVLWQSLGFAATSPLLGFIAGLFGCALGILLEAAVKSFLGRSKRIDRALAACDREAERKLPEGWLAGRTSPDESSPPSRAVTPAPLSPNQETGLSAELPRATPKEGP